MTMKDIKDIKDTIEKVKIKYGALRTEILLMILFVCVFCILNWGLAEEAAPVSGTHVSAVEKTEGETEETVSESSDETEEAVLESSGETDEEDTSEAVSEDNEGLSGKQSGAAGKGQTGSDRVEKSPEEMILSLRKTLSSLPEGFLYPMVFPETEQKGDLPLYTLADTRKLHGFRLLIPEEELEEKEKEVNRSLDLLKTMVGNKISSYDGDWSVYVKNLNTDESFVINDQPMKSASVMKLFIMGTVYEALRDGSLERTDELMGQMKNMISVSDNESANQLLYKLGNSSYEAGIEKVNRFIREQGFSEMTVEYNGFNNSATNTDSSHFNQISAADCGKLLEMIYHREWMNRSVSNEAEEMMLNQHTRYKIPAGLPEGVLCGNKSGEMDQTENDAAIIYGKSCDYVLVVLSGNWNSKDEAISRIASISAVVYDFLN